MAMRIGIMTTYLVILLLLGWAARRRARPGLADYFVASRSIPPIILFLTMAATNFSAFTVFGFAGAGWESGYAFYPIMAFGTGFMALTFVLIGRPVHRIGKAHGLVTPPELLLHLTGSRGLQILVFVVMTLFTLPYLAMQPMAAGYALESLLGIPYFAGAALITGILLLYTFLGGLRGVSWTDAFQGGLMLTLLLVAVVMIAARLGGLSTAHAALAATKPELFSRPGLNGVYTPGIWFGYMLLWFLCDPMFPQLFQRFYAARDARALTTTMTLYPLLTGSLFLLPITIGVLGRITYPTLPSGIATDQILPLMLSAHVPPMVETLVLTAALAALMSTLDSQLLTLSSMFTRDICAPLYRRFHKTRGRPTPSDVPMWIGKTFVVFLALVGLAIAYRPPASFRVIATQTFTGLAVLFPTFVAALYWRRMRAGAAIASILIGESLVALSTFGWLPSLGTLPVVPIVGVSALVLVAGSLAFPRESAWSESARPSRIPGRLIAWGVLVAGLFVLSNDYWDWGNVTPSFLGYPRWVWYSAGLCLGLTLAFALYGKWARTIDGLRDGTRDAVATAEPENGGQ
jgi:solute:Na+ symporter, SSS family